MTEGVYYYSSKDPDKIPGHSDAYIRREDFQPESDFIGRKLSRGPINERGFLLNKAREVVANYADRQINESYKCGCFQCRSSVQFFYKFTSRAK